jgi:beta-glucosidase
MFIIIDYRIPSVTENGFAVSGENDMPLDQALKDTDRVNYFLGTTAALLAAINEDSVDIRAYFPWSTFLRIAPFEARSN